MQPLLLASCQVLISPPPAARPSSGLWEAACDEIRTVLMDKSNVERTVSHGLIPVNVASIYTAR